MYSPLHELHGVVCRTASDHGRGHARRGGVELIGFDAIAAETFRAIERVIGALDEGLGTLARAIQREPRREGRQRDGAPLELKAAFLRTFLLLAYRAQCAYLVGIGQQHRELLAAVARHEVVMAEDGEELNRDHAQRLVAGSMAELVVDDHKA